MEYTKGEWKVEPIIKNTIFGIFTEYHHYELARVFIHNGEQEANANLIASAPDLHEALKLAVEYFESLAGVPQNVSLFNKTLSSCDKAIKKAEGKGC